MCTRPYTQKLEKAAPPTAAQERKAYRQLKESHANLQRSLRSAEARTHEEEIKRKAAETALAEARRAAGAASSTSADNRCVSAFVTMAFAREGCMHTPLLRALISAHLGLWALPATSSRKGHRTSAALARCRCAVRVTPSTHTRAPRSQVHWAPNWAGGGGGGAQRWTAVSATAGELGEGLGSLMRRATWRGRGATAATAATGGATPPTPSGAHSGAAMQAVGSMAVTAVGFEGMLRMPKDRGGIRHGWQKRYASM
jgi:hypothetical protein